MGPSLVVYKGHLYAFWKGSGGDQNVCYTFFDDAAGEFRPKTRVLVPEGDGIGSSVGPTTSVTPSGLLMLSWKGTDGDNLVWWALAALEG